MKIFEWQKFYKLIMVKKLIINIKQYCIEYDIKLILSSLYHPQTNGSVEVTHKEIQKYIFNEYLNKKVINNLN